MAKPTFPTINKTRSVLINTPDSLTVTFTDTSVRKAWAEGYLIRGGNFSHAWNATTRTLTITGQSSIIQYGVSCILKASSSGTPSESDTASFAVTYNITPKAPVFGTVPTDLTIYKGGGVKIDVPITNNPTGISVKGPWLGITHKRTENGIQIVGNVPDADLGIRSGRFEVEAVNGGGTAKTTASQLTFAIESLGAFDGSVTRVGNSTAFGISETFPLGLAFDPNSETLYMTGGDGDYLSTIDRTTGAATRVGNSTKFGISEGKPYGLAFDPNSETLYMVGWDKDYLSVIDTTTGAATRVGTSTQFGIGEPRPSGLAFDPNSETLYMVGRGRYYLCTLDTTTGAATRVGSSHAFGLNETQPIGLAYDPNTGTLYMTGSARQYLCTVNTTTGVATRVGNATRFGINEGHPSGLAFDRYGSILYLMGSWQDYLSTFDRT